MDRRIDGEERLSNPVGLVDDLIQGVCRHLSIASLHHEPRQLGLGKEGEPDHFLTAQHPSRLLQDSLGLIQLPPADQNFAQDWPRLHPRLRALPLRRLTS